MNPPVNLYCGECADEPATTHWIRPDGVPVPTCFDCKLGLSGGAKLMGDSEAPSRRKKLKPKPQKVRKKKNVQRVCARRPKAPKPFTSSLPEVKRCDQCGRNIALRPHYPTCVFASGLI